MRVQEVGRVLVGSVVVYLGVAACAASVSPVGGTMGDAGVALADVVNDILGSAIADVVQDIANPVPPAHAEPYQSGSRVKAKYRLGEDGTKEFLGWYDSTRREDCSFATAGDGVTRCLPVAIDSTLFADSACTQPVAFNGPGCTSPLAIQYAQKTIRFGSGCTLAVRLTRYQFGAAIPNTGLDSGATTFYGPTVVEPAGCVAHQVASGGAYLLGPEVPPTSFVAATESVDP